MNDKKIVLLGLVGFFGLLLLPFWWNQAETKAVPQPALSAKAQAAGTCIESKDVMAKTHMQILNVWRDTVVRGGDRVYVNSEGKEFAMSLSSGEDSCLGCHTSKADFCDKCHEYTSVRPYCWDCHIDPKENK